MSSAIRFNLDQSKILSFCKGLEAFTDNKLNVGIIMISLLDMMANILAKEENAGY